MIALLLAHGFEEVEALTPVDLLRRAGLDVRLVGVGATVVQGGHGIRVEADTTLDDLDIDQVEGLILPGGGEGTENLARSKGVLDLVRELFARGNLVAAICAAPAVVLQGTGVLKGRRVTCYPGFEDRLSGCSFLEDRVVVDGNLVTSRGPGTAAEFSLALIEILVDRGAAEEIRIATLQAPTAG